MRSFCFLALGVLSIALYVLSGVGLSGCVAGSGQCKKPVGDFRANYVVLDGNCRMPLSRDVTFDKDASQNDVSTKVTLSDAVTTVVNLVGCSVGITQRVTTPDNARKLSDLEGELQVMGDEASALEGVMLYKEYMPDGQTVACTSRVEASLTLGGPGAGSAGPLGPAAQRALGLPKPIGP